MKKIIQRTSISSRIQYKHQPIVKNINQTIFCSLQKLTGVNVVHSIEHIAWNERLLGSLCLQPFLVWRHITKQQHTLWQIIPWKIIKPQFCEQEWIISHEVRYLEVCGKSWMASPAAPDKSGDHAKYVKIFHFTASMHWVTNEAVKHSSIGLERFGVIDCLEGQVILEYPELGN